MDLVKQIAVAFVSFIVLDFVWLGFVVKKFNLQQLAEIGRIKDGEFNVLYPAAGLAYVVMSLLVALFVLPKLSSESSWLAVAAWGGAMGFFVYGVYDFTNLAVLKNYPMAFALVDMTWGTIVFSLVSLITWKLAAS